MTNRKILIVEDEFIVANDLRIILTRAGYTVCGLASSVEQAKKLIEQKKPDWVLLDIILKGDKTGIDLAIELRQTGIPFLFISANTNQSTLESVKATRPYGFMVKPFRERDLLIMLDIARYRHELEYANMVSTLPVPDNIPAIEGVMGQSPALKETLKKIALVAPTPTSVLITGESGTGKEAIAHAVHTLSSRKNRPFITLNCAALPESLIESELFGHERGAFTGANNKRIGKFEQADGGTIFLDEIGELPLDSQIKLLRVLQEKEIERLGGDDTIKVDVRIVAATNRNLEKEVAEGRFRLDLYYRLNVFPVQLPALRNRREDIEILVLHFIEKYARQLRRGRITISGSALDQLKTYNWPGNIRELQHLIERTVILAPDNSQIENIELPRLPVPMEQEISGQAIQTMEEMERTHIMNALKECGGRVSGHGGAAEILNVPATTLYSKMKKLGIKQGYY